MDLKSLILPLLVLACSWAACSSSSVDSSPPNFPTVVTLGGCDLCPSIVNTSLSVGSNRVIWNLIDDEDNTVVDARIRVRYYDLGSREPRLAADTPAEFISAELSFNDEANGSERTAVGEDGVYVTYASFDKAGDWGAEVSISRGDGGSTELYRFTVREDSEEPSIGDPAPPSRQATTSTAALEDIDSSFPLRPSMHAITIADAIAAGRPAVVVFATPAYCTSRTCAPVLEAAIDPLLPAYDGRVTFIHIEPYVLRDLRAANVRNPVPAALEWRLRTEPWVFIIDADGKIAAKFEGLVSAAEVERALNGLLAASSR